MFLGVDGGGTKTAFCLVDRSGQVVARAQAASSYYFSHGIDLVERVLKEGVDAVCTAAGLTPADVEYAFFGLPGYGEAAGDLPVLNATPRAVLGHDRYACDNDMVCGWAGSLGALDGINVISGTGSMTYGERLGNGVRVGGWGEIFGDEGSAYWIAIRGLNAFSRMSDGRLPEGPLSEVLRRRLDLASDLDVIDVVHNRWQGDRGRIAALGRSVAEAAGLGDEAAAAILTEAGRELAQLVEVTRERLEFGPDETVPVSYSGGTFGAGTVLEAFTTGLKDRFANYELRDPLYEPVVGAALYAAKLAGTPLDRPALDALRTASESLAPGEDGR
ncbi:BadF/BadG/BcrA/BcrD ATPase family protein [Streptomyces hygroscopicus]|uniref:BadF/BadG/BcrA/BcrD ATPase family protein n=1 Tax=Streptomyces hygroscopicus TaxID=1912 RepID=UPI000767A5ED|nr:BadF/BadG/BcrA/BcrD ATPase family protein [Streptomyces hygroscopicus]GLV76181.1 N-acetylglucosamine kinase [Streptomyces hygroscopicus subsp. hygroscopicus]